MRKLRLVYLVYFVAVFGTSCVMLCSKAFVAPDVLIGKHKLAIQKTKWKKDTRTWYGNPLNINIYLYIYKVYFWMYQIHSCFLNYEYKMIIVQCIVLLITCYCYVPQSTLRVFRTKDSLPN